MVRPVAVSPLAGLPSPGLILGGFIAGVALQLAQPVLWLGEAYAALLVVALGLMALSLRGIRGRVGVVVASLALCFAAALLGFSVTGWRASLFDATRLNLALEGRDIEVIGEVLALPQSGEEGVRFRLGVESARLDDQPVRLPPQILLGWYVGFGAREAKAAALESGEASELELQRQPQRLEAGERWQMRVRLKAPHGNSNPHGFDYELWLWEQGLQATGYVRAGPRDAPPRKLSTGGWTHSVERARQSVRSAISRVRRAISASSFSTSSKALAVSSTSVVVSATRICCGR